MQKAVFLCNVIGQEYRVRTPVENLCDALKGLLARSVPYLQLESNALDLEEQGAELNTHCHLVVIQKLVVAHSMHQTRLADRRVSNHYQLEDVLWLRAYGALADR